MKTKVGTILDRELLLRARSAAAREGKRLNQFIEEALEDHLKHKTGPDARRVTTRSAGCLRLPKGRIDRVLAEEPGLLDR